MGVKLVISAKKFAHILVSIASTCICEYSKYLKSIADTSVIECDEIISDSDIILTKNMNTIATNVTKNCLSKGSKI